MITIDKYTAVQLEEYNGAYSLVEGWAGKDGTFKPNWCEVEFGKEKIKKNVPKKVKLGDKAIAISALEETLAELRGEDRAPF